MNGYIIKGEEVQRLKDYERGPYLYDNNLNVDCFFVHVSPKKCNNGIKNIFSVEFKLLQLPVYIYL